MGWKRFFVISAVVIALATLLVWALVKQVPPELPKPNDPCWKHMHRIAGALTRIAQEPDKIRQLEHIFQMPLRQKRDSFAHFVEAETGLKLLCPLLQQPYAVLPGPLFLETTVPVILSDPKPHPDGSWYLILPLPHRKTGRIELFQSGFLVTPTPIPDRVKALYEPQHQGQ